MNRHHAPAAAAIVAVFLAATGLVGCGTSSNPLESAQRMVKAHGGSNTPITVANADSAAAAISAIMGTSFQRSFQSVFSSLFNLKLGRRGDTTPITITLEEAIHAGLNNGSLTVKGGKIVVTSGTLTSIHMETSFEYDDFSDDGVVFIGGTVDATVDVEITTATAALDSLHAVYKANIATTGKYNGAMSMNLTVDQGTTGPGTLAGTATVGGKDVEVNLTGFRLF